ncbi:MAG: hypothetical protein Q7S21_05600 [archaeon]|nr:hypothetical protein [archaeon]
MGIKESFAFLKWIDPFTYVEIALRKFHPKKSKPSFADEAIDWIVYLISALVFAYLIYAIFGLILNTNAPMVIVVSGSMEPVYFRGDVVVLQGKNIEKIQGQEVVVNENLAGKHFDEFASPIRGRVDDNFETIAVEFNNGKRIDLNEKGDIIVYFSAERAEPIIHRVVAKIQANDGIFFLTKGDSVNNPFLDEEVCGILPDSTKAYCVTPYPIKAEEVQGTALFKIPWIGYVKLLFFDDIPRLLFGR